MSNIYKINFEKEIKKTFHTFQAQEHIFLIDLQVQALQQFQNSYTCF